MNKCLYFYSPSKLNLGLRIIGKNNDNYHLLNTIFCFISLIDKIKIENTNNQQVMVFNSKADWSHKDDLTYKAAMSLKKFTNVDYGANITVYKNIPVCAGLGGGSSNCAVVLYALNKIWNINLSINELAKIGLTLGADVPFFLNRYNAFATNIGEVLTPIKIFPYYFILVKPNISISTKLIFDNLNFSNEEIIETYSPESLLLDKKNDLEETIVRIYPQIKKIIEELKPYGNPTITGTGSVIYLQFDDYLNAKKVANILNTRYNIYLVKTLEQNPIFCELIGESPSGKASDFDSDIRRFDPYLPCH